MSEAALWVDPSRCTGKVCLTGTRLYTSHVANNLAFYTIDDYREHYALDGISDRDIYVAAAWWVLNEPARDKSERQLKKAWKVWAETTWLDAWKIDYQPSAPPQLTP